jgi:hypothetical protein
MRSTIMQATTQTRAISRFSVGVYVTCSEFSDFIINRITGFSLLAFFIEKPPFFRCIA